MGSPSRGDDPRRVVITGMGTVTSLGSDVATLWQALLDGRSGVSQIRQFDSDAFPVRIGSEVDLSQIELDGVDELTPWLSRTARFGIWAQDQAWRDAGLRDDEIDPWRAGVCIGASNFPVLKGDLVPPRYLIDGDHFNAASYLEVCRLAPEILAQRDIGTVSVVLSGRHPLRGTSMAVQTACASATQAVGEAFQMIRHGDADLMVAGGARQRASRALCVAGFTAPRRDLARTRATRPRGLPPLRPQAGRASCSARAPASWSSRSSSTPGAAARRSYAEVIGYGSPLRRLPLHRRPPRRRGRGRPACRPPWPTPARPPDDVDYINAHGTAHAARTTAPRRSAIKRVFGEHARDAPDQLDEVDARPPARRRRRRRAASSLSLALDDRGPAADDQPRDTPTRPATSTTCRNTARAGADVEIALSNSLRLRRPERHADRPALGRVSAADGRLGCVSSSSTASSRSSPARRLRAVKSIGQMDGYLTAHYPRRPIVPATLVVEALAQAGGWLNLISRDFGVKTVLGLIEGARVLRPVQPGDVLTLDVDILYVHSDGATVRGQASVGGETVATVDRIVFVHAVEKDEAFRQRQRDYFDYINGGRPRHDARARRRHRHRPDLAARPQRRPALRAAARRRVGARAADRDRRGPVRALPGRRGAGLRPLDADHEPHPAQAALRSLGLRRRGRRRGDRGRRADERGRAPAALRPLRRLDRDRHRPGGLHPGATGRRPTQRGEFEMARSRPAA